VFDQTPITHSAYYFAEWPAVHKAYSDMAIAALSGKREDIPKVLAEHDDVDAIWSFGDEASAAAAKAMSVGNLKQVWTNEGRTIDWFNPKLAEGRWFLEHATQVKNIWVPYGE